MTNKMMDSFKNHWTAGVISAIACGGLALSFIYRRKIYPHVWRLKIRNIIRGTNKRIYIISTPKEWEDVAPEFIRSDGGIDALGFDCEWYFHQKRRPVALLQLATFSGTCALLQLPQLNGNIPHSLKELLVNDKIIKVGVDPLMDSKYLQLDYNIQVRGCVDLRYLAVETYRRDGQLNDGNGGIRNKLGLGSLAESHIGKKLNKSKKIRLSNWETKILTNSQISYASEDALVGVHLLLHFVGKLSNFEELWPLFRRNSWQPSVSKAIDDICSVFKDEKFRTFSRDSSGSPEKKPGLVCPPNRPLKEFRQSYSMRKTPLYHNSQLWAPDNEPLCTCDPQKALWYVNKGLGELVSEDPLIVKLKFEPAGRPNKEGNDGQFYLQERENICVVCGTADSYIRKNIIPHEYRKHFPEILKSHQSHDVVLLCAICHRRSNIRDTSLRFQLASKYDAPIGFETDVKVQIDGRRKTVRSAAGALLKSRDRIPQERIEHLESILRNYYNCETIAEDQLKEASVLDVQIRNEDYLPHGYKIYSAFERTGLIHLEEMWRQWFLETMQPKYLPDKWSVTHNHQKLKMKMSLLPLHDDLRRDYKIALVGTEGSIDVPFVPKSTEKNNRVEKFFGLE